MKGKFLKKLKSIGQMGSLKPGRVLQVTASDGFLDPFPPDSGQVCKAPPVDESSQPEPDIIDISELLRELGEEEEEEPEHHIVTIDKENIRPPAPPKIPIPSKECTEIENRNSRQRPLSKIEVSGFRLPELNSGTLFDPDLLTLFQQAVKDHYQAQDSERRGICEAKNLEKDELPGDPLLEFEEWCPPGGTDSVVLYTTSIRGIRKTFEDCNRIRFLLGSLKVLHSERDVSMHLEFREELWKILGGRVVPPRLFIRGRYIGGADEVLCLHEQGKLVKLLKGMPIDRSNGKCDGCGGVRFVLCLECSGSRRIAFDEGELPVTCFSCNENGLIICPSCCWRIC